MNSSIEKYDLICVGGGIMSATLALLLKLLDADKKILILERLDEVSQESSASWNNSGTGHSGFCELNYTPEKKDGSIDVTKALDTYEKFEKSKEFWAFLVEEGMIENPEEFIRSVPHHAWVTGEEQVEFLKKRFEALKKHIHFEDMQFTEDLAEMTDWFPLITQGRGRDDVMAATRAEQGTELDFEVITKKYFQILTEQFDTEVLTGHEVKDIDPERGNDWLVEVENLNSGEKFGLDADHVFIGAGGRALSLLQKVEIDEKEGYGGFPVSGEWLVCNNRDVIEKFDAKVYSKAGVDAPPMAAPHLDTRHIDGKRELMFGPFAAFNTKFLKEGSYLDLPKSITFNNIPAYWGAFWHNLDLTKYLIGQISMDHEDRMEKLREFVVDAKSKDWELMRAGQRVQIIKRDKDQGGILEFGTDVVHSKDGSISALLGASPGASTAVDIMIGILQTAFPEKMKAKAWREKLTEMVPFWNRSIAENEVQFRKKRELVADILGLKSSIESK
ncbi:malate dehydrogenase (quinone) [Halocola ammonii]